MLYTCDVFHYVLFIDGNGDSYGCYNPFRAVNRLNKEKDPFYFGNLMSQSFEEVFSDKNSFRPVMDVSLLVSSPGSVFLRRAQPRS